MNRDSRGKPFSEGIPQGQDGRQDRERDEAGERQHGGCWPNEALVSVYKGQQEATEEAQERECSVWLDLELTLTCGRGGSEDSD